ncbi:MAG: hypothetical protein WDZ79_02885 [Candidatus Paceibacterota bacterium]
MIYTTQQHAHTREGGISLLVAVIVVGMVLFIATSISGVSYHQLQLSSIGENSQYAFYAADSGIECALYWDLLYNAFPTPGDTSAVINSKIAQIECNGATGSDLAPSGASMISVVEGVDTVTTTFQVPNLLVSPPACAHQITVTESLDKGLIKTEVESRAKNDCGAPAHRAVERAVRVTY